MILKTPTLADIDYERHLIPYYREAANGAGWPDVVEKLVGFCDSLTSENAALRTNIEALETAAKYLATQVIAAHDAIHSEDDDYFDDKWSGLRADEVVNGIWRIAKNFLHEIEQRKKL